ncbi:hypothetical protein V8D89_005055 [Ganoderma adspersum]
MTDRLNISDLPRDVLFLILWSLHGQDVARCIAVCHYFADLIHSDISLQYRIELAQNGMVDGESSTLPVSERLQRLRQYSSNFKRGAFHHEDLTAHPDHLLQQFEVGWPRVIIAPKALSGAVYKMADQDDSPLYLSLAVPGSAQGGIPSSRSLFTVREAMIPDLIVTRWTKDDAQDLFVVEMTRTQMPPNVNPDVYIRFYSLSSFKTDTAMPHPAAAFPFIRLHTVGSGEPAGVYGIQIFGQYVIVEICMQMEAIRSYTIDVYNWKTGQLVSRMNVGKVPVSILSLYEPYLLLFPSELFPELHPDVRIYSFSPSTSPGESVAAPSLGRHVCTLELPPAPPGEHILCSQAYTGDRAEETTGHFRADTSRSLVVLHIRLRGPAQEDDVANRYDTYLLVPRTTLAAQIHAAEFTSRQRDGDDTGSGSEDTPWPLADQPEPRIPPCVPWAGWGPRGCLRLRLRSPLFHVLFYDSVPTPFGSRMPVVMSDGREDESASVYVFDVNPLVARSTGGSRVDAAWGRGRASDDSEGATVADTDAPVTVPRPAGAGAVTAVVEDIEEVLPGVVDPECAAIPYVAYCFPLAYPSRAGPPDEPKINRVAMSMTGFTIEMRHDLIHADLSLQYRIELAQNGMVDGECSTLPVSERLQRLRQYSANFKSGAFQHEDLTAHSDYALRDRELGWPRTVLSAERPSGGLYKKSHQDDSPLYLSLFVPGSVQGGIPSARSLFILRDVAQPELTVMDWAMDTTQDLFAMAEMTHISDQEEMAGKVPEVYIRFYAFSGLKTDEASPHPAATLPFIRLHVIDSGSPKNVFQLQIFGDYVILEPWVDMGADLSFFVDVYNWKTGQMISTLNVGTVMVSIIPLDEPYLLLFPSVSSATRTPERHANISIYSFYPSPSPCPESEPVAGRHVCTLELPAARPGEHVTWSRAHTGDHAAEATGHFRVDPSRSIVVLHICIQPIEGGYAAEYPTHVLIPRATLAAQIRAVDPTWLHGTGSTTHPPALVSVPWAEWGPRGCLRLRPWNALFQDDANLTAFGSRMPVVLFDGPEEESASVYVFDVNPFVARSVLAARRRATSDEETEDKEETSDPQRAVDALPRAVTVTAVVGGGEDIEEVLPGVVDPECAAIPYVVYRFPLPFFRGVQSPVAPQICEVAMSMAGFTVEFDGSVEYEMRNQTWTV